MAVFGEDKVEVADLIKEGGIVSLVDELGKSVSILEEALEEFYKDLNPIIYPGELVSKETERDDTAHTALYRKIEDINLQVKDIRNKLSAKKVEL